MLKKLLSFGIIMLFLISGISPLVFGTNLETTAEPNMSDYEFASVPYDSDSTVSETILISEYLNPQPTVLLDNGLMDSSWPMLCYDIHHTSQSPYIANDGNGLEKWRFRASDGVESSPVVDSAGNIYFGDKDGWVYAIYPNGTLKWRYRAQDWGWITSAPALSDDGILYVGSWDDYLYAFNVSTGQCLWRRDTGSTIVSSPIQAPDGIIYVTTMAELSNNGSLVAVNPNGTILWKYPTGYSVTADPVLGDDGTIYFGGLDTYFYAINPNGTLKWRYKTGDWIKGPASIANDDTVYVYSWDNYLYAFYPDNGTVCWRTKLTIGTETNPSIGNDGTIYVGGTSLWAVYPNGTIKWEFPLDPEFRIWMSCPAISADGIIYFGTYKVGSSAGDIMAVYSNGTLKWKKRISGYFILSSPCIASDGTVYIGNTAEVGRGYLHAFGPVESNSPPETPIITGKTQGAAGEQYYYKFVIHDPDNNPIRLYIEWGDGSSTGWTTEWASNEDCYYPHTYAEQGQYTIRCKAKDVFDEESDWGTLEVSMPLSYHYPFWSWLQSHFPLLVRILELLTPLQI